MNYYYDDIVKMQRIPDAFSRWSDYRERLTSLLVEQAKKAGWDSFLYVGCGDCNDIDLGEISKVVSSVVLLDRESISLEEIETRYKIKKGVLSVIKGDISGLMPDYFYGFEELLMKERELPVLLNYLENVKGEIEKQKESMLKKEWDASCCIGVHSQCLAPFAVLLKIYSKTYKKEEQIRIHDTLRKMNESVAQTINNKLLRCSGQTVIGYEFGSLPMEINKNAQEELRINYIKGELNQLYKKGVQRVSGAYECEKSLQELNEKGILTLQHWTPFVWPFSNVKTYLMALMILEYNSENN